MSVRSAEEARQAVLGGASVIDIKEPDRGPLGRADSRVWGSVREAVPASIPVSVALGELADWSETGDDYAGISYRKLGLAGAGPRWRSRWDAIRLRERGRAGWIAVAYADWELARSPDPRDVLDAAIQAEDCSGILVDTWDKTKPTPLTPSQAWRDWVHRARENRRFVALAGGLDRSMIVRLSALEPELFAVRGAACDGLDRSGEVRAGHVAGLVRTIEQTRSDSR